MEMATLQEGANRQYSDDEVFTVLKRLDERAYNESYVPDISEIPLLENPERHLSSDHYNLLLNEGRTLREQRIIATIFKMSPLLRSVLDKGYKYPPKLMKHYMTLQGRWAETAFRLQAGNFHVSLEDLTEDQKMEAFVKKGTPEIFKVYYSLMFPENVVRRAKQSPMLAVPLAA